ncbi:uncharacterized protein I206_101500 [Kwoniella pini CBS 10737]|uniref:Thioredoxin-like fold domain-containing protein n=1 Tax=Kwoniella pini CBS 10737 TaxID=1296096 RepID=A0A1B9HWH6_9TREE|nr:uncharacterized protein I206_06527 [Kwoniella pini CBS 10737]OCF47624.1 hypothetical protein I206_06527 [Kwoniella pini CBS 10737]
MSLPKSLSFLRQGTGEQVLDIYLDPLCPFSAKITKSITTNLLPLITKGGKYEGKLSLVTRIYPQPFHYFAVFHTEALIIFGKLYHDLFWEYLTAIFDSQNEYFNQSSSQLTPSQTRDKLVELATDLLEQNKKINGPKSKVFGEIRDKLEVKSSPNGGNEATDDFKYLLKVGRQNGIQVTPSAILNGLKDDSVSSSWGKEEWEKWLS